MRTSKEIKRKIKDLRYRYLQKKYKKLLARRPENCKFNFRQPLKGENTTIGLCIPNIELDINEQEWQGDICDTPDDAKDCERYVCKYSKKKVTKEFNRETEDIEICREKYRDILMLKWVLEKRETLFQRFLNLFRKKQEEQNDVS